MTAKNTARVRACAVQTSTGTTRSGQALKICTVYELARNFKTLVTWLWRCLMISQDSNLTPQKQAWLPRGHNNTKSCFLKEWNTNSGCLACLSEHVGCDTVVAHMNRFSHNGCKLQQFPCSLRGETLTGWEEWRTKWLNLSKVRKTSDRVAA